MVPASFVLLDSFPLSANGKVDRQALLTFGENASLSDSLFVAPRTDKELILAKIWTSLLRVEQVGIHDNFFSLGGDSILTIQIVARARQAGLHLTAKQLFQYQTIAKLAAVIETSQELQEKQQILPGPVPLTPIQRWFFTQKLSARHHYNQALILETRKKLQPILLHQAIQQILLSHDAFGLYFVQKKAEWHQYYKQPQVATPFLYVDLSLLNEKQQMLAMETIASDTQQSFDLSACPLLRCIFYARSAEYADCLLFVIHHLVVDSVSWRILLADLEMAYLQLSRGERVSPSSEITSFRRWAHDLYHYAQSAAIQQELSYWLAPQRRRVPPLPLDLPDGSNSVASSEFVTVTLGNQETRALLQAVPAVYHTQVNDMLLAALVLTCNAWTGERTLLVDLESHGREELLDGHDLSQTVGWFSSVFPLLLDIEQATSPGSVIKAIKEQIRQVRNHGIGYGLLRYLNSDPTVAEQLARLPQAQISFNYLGQFDPLFADLSLVRMARVSSGPAFSQQGLRSHLLMVNGAVVDGQLRFTWQYSRQIHLPETVQGLAQRFLGALEDLIAHCQSSDAGGYTPSDFPLAALEQASLDRMVQSIQEQARERGQKSRQLIEDVYPLSPMQTGLLFHSLYSPESLAIRAQSLPCLEDIILVARHDTATTGRLP